MNYISIKKDDMTDGPGIRVTIWFAGCTHKCRNCFNKETWDPKYGKEFTNEIKYTLFSYCKNPLISGLTLSGGDPFFIDNRNELNNLVHDFKKEFPKKTIWCWTGYKIEELLCDPECQNILSCIDVLIDGEFDYQQRAIDLKQPNAIKLLNYRGSSNQRIIDIQKTLKENKISLYNE